MLCAIIGLWLTISNVAIGHTAPPVERAREVGVITEVSCADGTPIHLNLLPRGIAVGKPIRMQTMIKDGEILPEVDSDGSKYFFWQLEPGYGGSFPCGNASALVVRVSFQP